MTEHTEKKWLAMPAVKYSTVEVIEVTNKAGEKKLFRAQRWECCVRLTSIENTIKPALVAILALSEGPLERALGNAFDAFIGKPEKTGFLLSASTELIDWFGPFDDPDRKADA